MASASTSTSSSVFPRNYHVFINHRGPDVKKTFASHLYHCLLSHGLQVFLDQQELERGENTPPQIERAIDTSSVHVAIFSPGYADSEWCLDELVLMLKSRATRGATIIPVFYKVKPSHLRFADKGYTGAMRIFAYLWEYLCESMLKRLLMADKSYTGAMRNHEKRYDQQKITNWKRALHDVSLLSGFELETCNGDEGELVHEVARQVLKNVGKEPLPVATHPTGLDVKLQDFEVILERQQHREGPNVVGIVGLGGVGKTTLAKYFFNIKTSDYQQSCFLPDVRDAAARHSLKSLQSKLFRDLTGRDQSIDNVDDGIAKLKHRLSCGQALVILDDVDDVVQLDALFSPVKDALPSGSLVLLTSRNMEVLSISAQIAESSIYNMTGLGFEHSQELFCSHAFLQPHPPAVEYKELVEKFLDACQGLPLSLEVFGALLYLQNLEVWEAQLLKLKDVLPEKIQSRLKISYDSLDKQEKEIFLDIACFFIGTDRDTAIRVWDGSGWVGSLSLMKLQSKCLVTVDSENRIRMHDHLRDLGRDLAENEPPGCPRRLWRPADDLFRNVPPQSTVRGISLDHPFGVYFQSNSIVEMSGVRLLRGPLDSWESQSIMKVMKRSDLLWIHNKTWPRLYGSTLDVFELMDAFQIPINNLRVLELGDRYRGHRHRSDRHRGDRHRGDRHRSDRHRGDRHRGDHYIETKLWNDESKAPRELRELTIHLHLDGLPNSIGQLRHLEKIQLNSFGGSSLPEEFRHLRSLKHLTIWATKSTLMLPDSLGNLTNLQHIDLRNFSFQTLPSSFGNLTKLQHVSLKDCSSLIMLPGSFKNLIRLKDLDLGGCCCLTLSGETLGNISTLEMLKLSGCEKIKELPPQVTHQQSLQELFLDGTTLLELPSTIEDLGNLEILVIGSWMLDILPASLGNLTSLKKLRLCGCLHLKSLPDSVGKLKHLTSLRIYHSAIRNLPVGVRELNNLKKLTVKDCPIRGVPFASGRSLDSSIHRCMLQLRSLTMRWTRITEISFGEGVCPVLQHLDLRYSPRLVKVGALPTTLISLNVQHCGALQRITGLRGRGQTKLIIESNKVLQVSYTGDDSDFEGYCDNDPDTSDNGPDKSEHEEDESDQELCHDDREEDESDLDEWTSEAEENEDEDYDECLYGIMDEWPSEEEENESEEEENESEGGQHGRMDE